MKTKGITIWEQHLERFVLGIAVLVFLGFTVIQFIGNPNVVEKAGATYSPRDVDDKLRERADEIAARLDPNAPAPPLPEPKLVSERIDQLLVGRISPAESLPPVNWPIEFPDVYIPEPDQEYAVPVIPAPQKVVARPYWDALEDSIVQQIGELQAITPDSPHDITWITVASVFSIADVLEQFSRRDDAHGRAPIPTTWYDGVRILDVKIEREEQIEGQWRNRTTLDVLPGQYTLRKLLSEDMDATSRNYVLTQLDQPGVQVQIVQPEFYPTLNNTWIPPEVEETGLVEGKQLTPEEELSRSYQRRLAKLQGRYADVQAKLSEIGGPLEDPAKPPAGGGTGGGAPPGGGKAPPGGGKAPPGGGLGGGLGSGGGSGAGGGGHERGGGRGEDDQANRNKRIIITRELHKLKSNIDRLEAKLRELTGAVESETQAGPTGGEAKDFMAADNIRIWGHDITVQPGHTYRYRLTVDVSNPFFTRRTNLVKSQHALAESQILSSQVSGWSEPIMAREPLRAFVTAASPASDRNQGYLGLGQAQVEVYRFFHGRWWRESFAAEPGDRVGRVQEIRRRDDQPADLPSEIDFGTDWFILDIIDDPGGDPVRDKGRMAIVLLQSLSDGTIVTARDPRQDYLNPERQELRELVDLAELPSGAAQGS